MSDFSEGLDDLLALDGEFIVIDERAKYWVKFEVRRMSETAERPQGVRYSFGCLKQ